MGDKGSKPALVNEKAKTLTFRVAVDYSGDGEFRPVRPNPQIVTVGGRAKCLRCFAPVAPRTGEAFSVRVVAADLINHNPSYSYKGSLVIKSSNCRIQAPGRIEMPESAHGSLSVAGVKALEPQVTRLRLTWRSKNARSARGERMRIST